MVAAVVLLEFVCRIFVAAPLMAKAPITTDGPHAPIHEVRQLSEGSATSHFTLAGARLTGNPFLTSGRVGLIFGDSFVEALQVEDSQTMGSVMERYARGRHDSLNVRQYGWSGGSPSDYVLDAEDALRMWHPAWVVVFVTSNDFQPHTAPGKYTRVVVERDGSARIVPTPPQQSVLRARARSVLRRSSLLYLLNVRLNLVLAHSNPDSLGLGKAPDIVRPSVQLLRNAFGDRLAIVYKPYVPSFGSASLEPEETALLETCQATGVRCMSLREALLRERTAGTIMINGFGNTGLEEGHMNAAVHQVAGVAILDQLRQWKLE